MRKLSDQSVECWFINQHEARHETWALALTTVGERSRADGFRHLVDRRAFLVRKGFLRSVLSIYLGIPANTVQIHVGSSGKPYINSHDGIFFSCSSSREIAVVAITRHPKIGVDVEAVGQADDVSIASAFFSRSEQRLVEATMVQYSCSKSDATLHVWTQKEAYLKALGVGLQHLRDFELQYVQGKATVAETFLEPGIGTTLDHPCRRTRPSFRLSGSELR
ncbi:4'-phosphopantetheinyl transferase superfamily protein [Agrobacterium tumefaciens]|nr:4'-phosphopantetheinyl transferase superfamily protein [Agrobacterium tumefaciens]